MRRTPGFFVEADPEDFLSSPDGYLIRPGFLVGEYLENRRVLKALDDKFHFPELEGIIGNEEALTSLYVFNGTRFIKDKVANLFDDSEYSFPSMLASLYTSFVSKFDLPFAENTKFSSERELRVKLGEFLLCYKDFEEFNLLIELSEFIFDEINGPGKKSFSELYLYRSDYPFDDVVSKDLKRAVKSFQSTNRAWRTYGEFYNFTTLVWGNEASELTALTSKISHDLLRVCRVLRAGIPGTAIGDYVTRVSACLNLPDDKHAELNESELVDEWFILFDKFYPEYEKLKAWYVKHRERDELGVPL